jgi:hypothetical protein
MIRKFCDVCAAELTKENSFQRGLFATLRPDGGPPVTLSVKWLYPTSDKEHDVCIDCVKTAVSAARADFFPEAAQ